jgi:hypothetical protein
MMRIELPCYGIMLDTEQGGGSITSNLKEDIQYDPEHPDWDGPEYIQYKEEFNAMMDGVESMILAHACAGIDVSTRAYIKGIETAVTACGNNCG